MNSGFLHYFKKALTLPPHVVFFKALSITERKVKNQLRRNRDVKFKTFSGPHPLDEQGLNSFVDTGYLKSIDTNIVQALCNNYLEHRFDLLGSGWVQVKHPITADSEGKWLVGKINSANLDYAQEVWQQIQGPYSPIDWQLDFKSGYRWSENSWFGDIQYGNRLGVDVKVPWELARMQHLPVLAYMNKATEFQNQVLDFIATNPPRYGVNWKCTMDVGIRAANWLTAYDLFKRSGAQFSETFERIFFRSIYDHGHYIINHLEWSATLRSNHYLANIVGLLYCAAYLPSFTESDAWLSFSVQELMKEVETQFHPDGTNFEGSTSYHRLSSEMVLYATRLICAIPESRLKTSPKNIFSAGYLSRLYKMAEFSKAITKPNGNVVQIGDNDSGRFLKLVPLMSSDLEEKFLDHTHLIKDIYELFEAQSFQKPHLKEFNRGDSDLKTIQSELNSYKQKKSTTIPIIPVGQVKTHAFPDFGLYIFQSENIYLAFRCGSVGQLGVGGHAHHDQLSVELVVDGKEIFTDPGTFVYTPFPKDRNKYRSVASHFAPRVENQEPGRLDVGLFMIGNAASGRCVLFNDHQVAGYHDGYGDRMWRTIEILPNCIEINDYFNGAGKLLTEPEKISFSKGYGHRAGF